MLSILIPIYNFNTLPLIEELRLQLENEKVTYEILAADDKSDFIYQQQIPDLSEYANVHLLFPEQKLGRSKIRNYLAKKAKGDYLLFLDCDSKIDHNPHFIKNYLNIIKEQDPAIVVGGRIYSKNVPKEKKLHWLYGSKVEASPLKKRSKKPHLSLKTNNLLVKKKVWKVCPFDEELVTYGHEDTLFGIRLSQNNIPVFHMDNSVLHAEIEDNFIFLTKTEVALTNILLLEQKVEPSLLKEHVRIYRLYSFIRKTGMFRILLYVLLKLKEPLRKRLVKNPDLKLFSLYKLTFFLDIKNQS